MAKRNPRSFGGFPSGFLNTTQKRDGDDDTPSSGGNLLNAILLGSLERELRRNIRGSALHRRKKGYATHVFKDKFLVFVDVPGCTKENITITVKDGKLKVVAKYSIEVTEEPEEPQSPKPTPVDEIDEEEPTTEDSSPSSPSEDDKYEFSYKIDQTYDLPAGSDVGKIESRVKDGILSIIIPRKKEEIINIPVQ